MGIEQNTEEGVYQARIEGDITIYTVDNQLQALLTQSRDLTAEGMGVFDMDMSSVTEMDGAGLQLLVALKKHLEEMNWELRLRNPSRHVKEVLAQTQLLEDFPESPQEDGL